MKISGSMVTFSKRIDKLPLYHNAHGRVAFVDIKKVMILTMFS